MTPAEGDQVTQLYFRLRRSLLDSQAYADQLSHRLGPEQGAFWQTLSAQQAQTIELAHLQRSEMGLPVTAFQQPRVCSASEECSRVPAQGADVCLGHIAARAAGRAA